MKRDRDIMMIKGQNSSLGQLQNSLVVVKILEMKKMQISCLNSLNSPQVIALKRTKLSVLMTTKLKISSNRELRYAT